MKAKNILMSILLVTGFIAAKAAGYPPELALVSQPMMTYHVDHITVYYDVENIGDYTYRGSVCLYLYPDEGYSYAEKWVKVRPGRIKRIAIDIPAYRIRRGHPFTIMPYYEMGDELYSFTTFEYFEPITFFWEGPRNERWVVINIGPCPSYYHRPGHYRYYYDGYRPPMPPAGHGPGTPPPPMDPKHHTYGYHHNNGGYPGSHEVTPAPHSSSTEAPIASVRPKANGGSMSSASSNSGASTGSATGGSSSGRKGNGSSSGRVSGSSSTSNSRPAATTGSSSSGRTGNSSSSSRVSGSSSSSNSRPAATTGSSSSSKRSSASTGSTTRSNASTGSATRSGLSSTSGSSSSRTSGSSSSGRR